MIAPDDKRHGTNAGHVAGCRDECCRQAKLRYDKRRKHELVTTGKARRVPSIGYQRRLRALQALGWSYERLAPLLGCNSSTLGARTNAAFVSRANHERMVAVYNQLSMIAPVGTHVARDRRRAAAKGWAPPLCWDDDALDDPNAQPYQPRTKGANPELHEIDPVIVERAMNGERVKANVAERAEVIRLWLAAGKSAKSLEELQNWNVRRDEKRAAA